jgi:hypothetical protein
MQETEHYEAGDVVSVEAVVQYDTDHTDYVHLLVDGRSTVSKKQHVKLVRQFFKPGDPCIYADEEPAKVVHIHEDKAWIKTRDGNEFVVEAFEIRRPEAPKQPMEAAV